MEFQNIGIFQFTRDRVLEGVGTLPLKPGDNAREILTTGSEVHDWEDVTIDGDNYLGVTDTDGNTFFYDLGK